MGQIVTITFTEKAATTLKHRIVRKVDNLLVQGINQQKLKRIKAEMTQFQISPIHAFCSRILREYAAGTDVGFNVIEPFERRQLLNEVVRPELAAIANVPPTSTNRQDLALLLRHFGRSKLESMLSQFFEQKNILRRINFRYTTLSDDQI